jgi:hypothetical protein
VTVSSSPAALLNRLPVVSWPSDIEWFVFLVFYVLVAENAYVVTTEHEPDRATATDRGDHLVQLRTGAGR